MTVFRKFEVCASYESSVVKSPPSPSRKPLAARLYDDTLHDQQNRILKESIITFLNSVITLCPKVTKAELDYLQSGLTVTELKSKHFYILYVKQF